MHNSVHGFWAELFYFFSMKIMPSYEYIMRVLSIKYASIGGLVRAVNLCCKLSKGRSTNTWMADLIGWDLPRHISGVRSVVTS